MRIKLSGWSVLFLLGAICLPTVGHCDDALSVEQIERLISQLNSNRFGIRQTAFSRLLKAGESVLPDLHRVSDAMSEEHRHRVDLLIREIRLRALKLSFAKIVRVKDSEIDLDEGMFLIARILDPAVDRQALEQQLDDLASGVRRRLGADVVPKHAGPQEFVDALIAVLRDDFKLAGNVIDYDNPNNSSLKRVFATRQGLPILLSHVAVSVAERLDVPIVGLSVPGRYMIKYDGSRAPFGQPRDDIIIDPFGKWKIVTPEEIKRMISSFDPQRDLVPSRRRDSLTRMLRNLSSDLSGGGDAEKLAEVNHVLKLLEKGGQRQTTVRHGLRQIAKCADPTWLTTPLYSSDVGRILK